VHIIIKSIFLGIGYAARIFRREKSDARHFLGALQLLFSVFISLMELPIKFISFIFTLLPLLTTNVRMEEFFKTRISFFYNGSSGIAKTFIVIKIY